MNGMLTLRQLVEKKKLEVQGEMAMGYVDLEKAYDTILREMVMATLGWMEVPKAEVRLVDGMCKGTLGKSFDWSWDVRGVQHEHQFEAGKLSQPTDVYHGDGAGKQEGDLEGWYGEDAACRRSGCCGGEWVIDAGSAVVGEGGIWEAWAEDEYGEH